MSQSLRDPGRFVQAWLADPTHRLPLPDRGGRLFLAEGERIDPHHLFYAGLLADGSLTLTAPVEVETPDAQHPTDAAAAATAPPGHTPGQPPVADAPAA